MIQELNNDQRREMINSRQRFAAWRAAAARLAGYKGSMVWAQSKGITYLRRSYYEGRQGTRRHTSLGPRSAATEKQKADFEQGRREARARFKELREALDRQASINRAIGLGRIPLIAARILRALDDVDLLGNGLRVISTNAIRAYESAAGVSVDAEIAVTEDLDLIIDARA